MFRREEAEAPQTVVGEELGFLGSLSWAGAAQKVWGLGSRTSCLDL